MLHGIAAQYERVAAQDVIDIRSRLRQYIDTDEIGRSPAEILVHLRAADDQHRVEPELLQLLRERGCLGAVARN